MSTLCRACECESATIVEPCDDARDPYLLCAACHERLHSMSLRPLEWYNLARRHGWQQFLLHDDFYLDDGTATCPEEDVVDAERFPMPAFVALRDDPETLLDWCVARWHLGEAELDAWRSLDHNARQTALAARFTGTTNIAIRDVVLDIVGQLGDARSADFVRAAWNEYPQNLSLGWLAKASATTLPLDEGFPRVVAALADLPPSERRDRMYSLGYFASPAGLDWIEQNAFDPIVESWGYLAALCRPSWPRLAAWLKRGRPWSLIAIDTLVAITRRPTPLLQQRDVRLDDAPLFGELEAALGNYQQQDSMPRVTQRVALLLKDPARITRPPE